MNRLFHILFSALLVCLSLSKAEGQNYPIQVTPIVKGGTDMRWSTFYSDPDKLKVRVVHKDKDVGTVGIFFKIKIERAGISIRSREDLMPPQVQAVNMNFGQILDFTGTQLTDYFRPENLVVQGLPPEFLYQGGTLPDGFYMVSVTAYEYDAARGHRQVSNTGISSFAVFKGLPPIIQFPKDGQVFTEMAVQNVLFQWLPRTFSAPGAGGLSYRVELFMIDQGTNPQEAANSSQAIFTAMTSATSLPYGPGYPGFVPLQAGKQYALRVQVVSTDAGQQFANDGKSQVVSFSYGHSCVPPVNVSMAASDNFWDKLSWTPVAGAESYRVRFTSRVTGITDSTEVYGSYYDLYNPNRRDTLTYSIVSLCSAGRRSREVTAERPTERNLRAAAKVLSGGVPPTPQTSLDDILNPFDIPVNSGGLTTTDVDSLFNIIKHPNDEYQRPCGSAKVEDTSCDPVVITPQEGSEPFSIVAGKYMYLNGYEILISAPNEGLLYLPLIRSRIPVEWNNLTVYKNDEEDYGCVTEGEARMQGSVTGAIGRDLHRQVMALLTQGPGQWSGKLGDSFEAFVEIIEEIENTANPTPAQFSKFKNVGSIVNQALETWRESLQDRAGNAVADNMMAKIEQWTGTIQAALAVATPTKATATSVKAEATAASKSYKRSNVIEKVLIAIKNGKNNASVDISTLLDDYCTNTDAVVLGAVRKVYLDGQSYLPTQIGCNTLINIVELSLSEDKTKIEGLNLRGDAADVEAIWNWLGIVRSGDLRLIDLKDESRIAGLDETLYLVRTPIPGRDVKVAWDTSLSGELVNTHTSGHQISKGEVANTSTVYTSVSQSPLNHKSTFDKGGRQVHLEVIPQEKTSRKEGIGSDNGAWTDFNDILDKIADAIKKVNSNDFVQLGTKKKPCNGDAQFCLEFGVAAEAEVSTEYEELSGERFYQHLKKEGDVFSLSLGFSRSFVPKKLSMDTEYVTFKPNLTIGFGGEGAYNSYKKYTKKLPVETQYSTSGQNTHEASLQVGVQLYGGISATGGLKGAVDVWGEISVGADATILKVTYDFTNNKPAGSIGPLSAKVKGAYGYTIGPFKEKDEYDKEWEIIKELEIK